MLLRACGPQLAHCAISISLILISLLQLLPANWGWSPSEAPQANDAKAGHTSWRGSLDLSDKQVYN